MYYNHLILMGHTGSDAKVVTSNNRSFVNLSLATKTSYKDKQSGEYMSNTEWHQCVVFGKLADFAKTLKKGAHIQLEGELRSREYTSKKSNTPQRVWEIRVSSILKLDRAEKDGAQDTDFNPEQEAA